MFVAEERATRHFPGQVDESQVVTIDFECHMADFCCDKMKNVRSGRISVAFRLVRLICEVDAGITAGYRDPYVRRFSFGVIGDRRYQKTDVT